MPLLILDSYTDELELRDCFQDRMAGSICNQSLGQTLCGTQCCVEGEWCSGQQCMAIFPSTTISLEATESLSSILPTTIPAASSSSSPSSILISSSSTFPTQSPPSLTLSTQLSTSLTSQSPSLTTTTPATLSSSSSSSNLSVGAVVGIVISAVAGAAILILVGYLLARWRKKESQSTERLSDASGVLELAGAEIHEIAEPEAQEIAGAEVFPARSETIRAEDAPPLEHSKTGTAKER